MNDRMRGREGGRERERERERVFDGWSKVTEEY